MVDKRTFENIFDLVDDARQFLDENEGKINRVMSDLTVSLRDTDPLVSVSKFDSEIQIAVEMDNTGVQNIDVKYDYENDALIVGSGYNDIKFFMPPNCDTDNISAEANNGILNITVPRSQGGDENGTDE